MRRHVAVGARGGRAGGRTRIRRVLRQEDAREGKLANRSVSAVLWKRLSGHGVACMHAEA